MSFRSVCSITVFSIAMVTTGGVTSSGQSISDTYRKAATAYREAAAKTTEDKKGCYNVWASYYDCLAEQLVSGSNVKCDVPTCKPGE